MGTTERDTESGISEAGSGSPKPTRVWDRNRQEWVEVVERAIADGQAETGAADAPRRPRRDVPALLRTGALRDRVIASLSPRFRTLLQASAGEDATETTAIALRRAEAQAQEIVTAALDRAQARAEELVAWAEEQAENRVTDIIAGAEKEAADRAEAFVAKAQERAENLAETIIATAEQRAQARARRIIADAETEATARVAGILSEAEKKASAGVQRVITRAHKARQFFTSEVTHPEEHAAAPEEKRTEARLPDTAGESGVDQGPD